MLGFDSEDQAAHWKDKFSHFVLKNCEIPAGEFVCNLLSKIILRHENVSHF